MWESPHALGELGGSEYCGREWQGWMMERSVKKNNKVVNIVKIEESGGSHPLAKCKSQEKVGGV